MFENWWNAKECIRYLTFFFYSKEKVKIATKADFRACFERFFHYALLRPPSYAPIFSQIKGLMVIHYRGKFHQYSISGSQVINFQMFSWWCSIHEMAPFGEFLGLFYPIYGSILLKSSPDAVYCKTKLVCEQSFKIKGLSTNETYPNFTVLVLFWAQIYPWKTKNTAKNQNFLRNYILRTIKLHKSQVPDES